MEKLFLQLIEQIESQPLIPTIVLLYILLFKALPYIIKSYADGKQNEIKEIENEKDKEKDKRDKEKEEKELQDKIETRNKIDNNAAILKFEVVKKVDIEPIQKSLGFIDNHLKQINGSIKEHHANTDIHMSADHFVPRTYCISEHNRLVEKLEKRVNEIGRELFKKHDDLLKEMYKRTS